MSERAVSSSSSSGIGFCSALAILFVALKLTHYIDWSWLWVLAPLWIPTAVAMLIIVAFLIFSVLLG